LVINIFVKRYERKIGLILPSLKAKRVTEEEVSQNPEIEIGVFLPEAESLIN
jgi:hypothetical protein